MESYLTSVLKQFEYYKGLGEKTFEQLSFEELSNGENETTNLSIVILQKNNSFPNGMTLGLFYLRPYDL